MSKQEIARARYIFMKTLKHITRARITCLGLKPVHRAQGGMMRERSISMRGILLRQDLRKAIRRIFLKLKPCRSVSEWDLRMRRDRTFIDRLLRQVLRDDSNRIELRQKGRDEFRRTNCN